jgi:hypothetical protein
MTTLLSLDWHIIDLIASKLDLYSITRFSAMCRQMRTSLKNRVVLYECALKDVGTLAEEERNILQFIEARDDMYWLNEMEQRGIKISYQYTDEFYEIILNFGESSRVVMEKLGYKEGNALNVSTKRKTIGYLPGWKFEFNWSHSWTRTIWVFLLKFAHLTKFLLTHAPSCIPFCNAKNTMVFGSTSCEILPVLMQFDILRGEIAFLIIKYGEVALLSKLAPEEYFGAFNRILVNYREVANTNEIIGALNLMYPPKVKMRGKFFWHEPYVKACKARNVHLIDLILDNCDLPKSILNVGITTFGPAKLLGFGLKSEYMKINIPGDLTLDEFARVIAKMQAKGAVISQPHKTRRKADIQKFASLIAFINTIYNE